MKCENCGHDMNEHSEYVGCMHYEPGNPRYTNGYCSCRVKGKKIHKSNHKRK